MADRELKAYVDGHPLVADEGDKDVVESVTEYRVYLKVRCRNSLIDPSDTSDEKVVFKISFTFKEGDDYRWAQLSDPNEIDDEDYCLPLACDAPDLWKALLELARQWCEDNDVHLAED